MLAKGLLKGLFATKDNFAPLTQFGGVIHNLVVSIILSLFTACISILAAIREFASNSQATSMIYFFFNGISHYNTYIKKNTKKDCNMAQFDCIVFPSLTSVFAALLTFAILNVLFISIISMWVLGAIKLAMKLMLINENKALSIIADSKKRISSLFSIFVVGGDDLLEQFIFITAGLKISTLALFTLFILIFAVTLSFGNSVNLASEFIGSLIKDISGAGSSDFSRNWYVLSAVFVTILIGNLIGMLPHAFTITSSIVAPFFISVTVFFVFFYNIISKNGLKFFAGFLPAGTNVFIAPLIITIEIISTFAKFISLGVRLFANMFAGHLLLKVFYTVFYQILGSVKTVYFLGDLFILLFLTFITSLEIMIAFLQAFVMVLLTVLYLDESNNFINAH